MNGAWGRILTVDLTQETTGVLELEEDIYKRYLGGQALGAYLMFRDGTVGSEVTADDPRNALNFLVGPVTGASPGGRSCITTKSPYSFNCATTCGGLTPSEMKFAGWDGVHVVGRASDPVSIAVMDDTVEIRDASHLWGTDHEHTEHELNKNVQSRYDYRFESMLTSGEMPPLLAAKHPADPNKGIGNKRLARSWVIGRAGENLMWPAAVMSEGARAHGRAGSGYVMGSKNLKGITFTGTVGHPLADKQAFMDISRVIRGKMKAAFSWRNYGTATGWRNSMVTSCYPIRNWQEGSWEDPEALHLISGPFMKASSWVKKQSCRGCAHKCLTTAKVNSANPIMDGTITDMPDWEAMGVLGGNLGFIKPDGTDYTPNDPYPGDQHDMHEGQNKLLRATFIHDDLGIDYIDNGMNLSLIMELMQRNLITAADIDGINLVWGNIDAVNEMTYKMATRDGIGDKLANGAYETGKYFAELKGNPDIMNYVMTTHRYGQPAHTVRGGCKSALSYLTTVKPNCHTEGSAEGEALIGQQDVAYNSNSAVICMFVRGTWGADGIAAMTAAATGWNDWTWDDNLAVGARAAALCRMINMYTQMGDPEFTPQVWDGQTAPRWFNDPFTAGPWPKGTSLRYEDGLVVDKDKLYNEKLPEYWTLRGFTPNTGIPTAAQLSKLGISDVCGSEAAEMISKFGE
ncbi:aldehyde ferredoxin oxidoreductase C-terminal domain-containing protein [Halobacteriota archaeon]